MIPRGRPLGWAAPVCYLESVSWPQPRWSRSRRHESASRRSEAIFDVDSRRERIAELDARMAQPGFWDDQNGEREVIAVANELKAWVEPYDALTAKVAELTERGELLEMEPDADLAVEMEREVARLEEAIDRLELRAMLRGPDDARDALVTIHPGAGGTESQDCAEMLIR